MEEALKKGSIKETSNKARTYRYFIRKKFDEASYRDLVIYPVITQHIDFLICQAVLSQDGIPNFTPVLAIELNGAEHYNNSNALMRDKRKRHFLQNAKVFSDKIINFLVYKNDKIILESGEINEEFLKELPQRLKFELEKTEL